MVPSIAMKYQYFNLGIVKKFQVLLFNNYYVEHYSFVCKQLNDSKYSYVSLTIHLFSVKWSISSISNNSIDHKFVCTVQMWNSSIWSVDRTNPDQSGPRSNSNERVLHIPQSSRVGALLSDGFVSNPGHSLRGCLTSLQRCRWCILQPQPNGFNDGSILNLAGYLMSNLVYTDMKMYRGEKIQGLWKMILFVEIFANIKYFGFRTLIRVCKLSNETKNENVLKHYISICSIRF